jgi:hypothetical protein
MEESSGVSQDFAVSFSVIHHIRQTEGGESLFKLFAQGHYWQHRAIMSPPPRKARPHPKSKFDGKGGVA